MCIAIPLEVAAVEGQRAICARGSERIEVDLALIGPVAPGTFVLSHAGLALRALEPAEARLIMDALEGARRAAAGEPFEHLFADLVGREPELPAHLRS
jgi:hydrogenase expression/formation protein HypC